MPWSRFRYRQSILTTSGDVELVFSVARHLYRCRRHPYRCRHHLHRCRAHLYRCRASIRWFFKIDSPDAPDHVPLRPPLSSFGKRPQVAWVPALARSTTPISTREPPIDRSTSSHLVPRPHARSSRRVSACSASASQRCGDGML